MPRIITPFHGRANIVGRPEFHASLHHLLGKREKVDTHWGELQVGTVIEYKTPAPRGSFAIGEVKAMGLPEMLHSGSGSEHPGVEPGELVGFDLFQTGHELDAGAYYDGEESFYTLPWKEMACRFVAGREEPVPIGRWLMVEPDAIMTRRLVFSGRGTTLHLPGAQTTSGARTNGNVQSRVKLCAAKVLDIGGRAHDMVGSDLGTGDWALYNPMDAIGLRMNIRGETRVRAFLKLDDLEQAVRGDER